MESPRSSKSRNERLRAEKGWSRFPMRTGKETGRVEQSAGLQAPSSRLWVLLGVDGKHMAIPVAPDLDPAGFVYPVLQKTDQKIH